MLQPVSSHQEDNTSLGVTWRDFPQLGVFGGIGHLGKYAKTCQLPPNIDASPQVGPQVVLQDHPSVRACHPHLC